MASAEAASGSGGGAATSATAAKNASLSAERDRRRYALRQSNLLIWQAGGPTQAPTGSLDSNLKKNTAFVKRVKQGLGADAKEQLIKEMRTLNLDKYLDEIVASIVEGLSKCVNAKDSFAAVEVSRE